MDTAYDPSEILSCSGETLSHEQSHDIRAAPLYNSMTEIDCRISSVTRKENIYSIASEFNVGGHTETGMSFPMDAILATLSGISKTEDNVNKISYCVCKT